MHRSERIDSCETPSGAAQVLHWIFSGSQRDVRLVAPVISFSEHAFCNLLPLPFQELVLRLLFAESFVRDPRASVPSVSVALELRCSSTVSTRRRSLTVHAQNTHKNSIKRN